MKQQKSEIVCKYYLQGRCKFGQNCRYTHFAVQSFLMRHAQSEFNEVVHSSQNHIYSEQAKNQYHFNPKLIDCGITESGIKQIRTLNFPEEMMYNQIPKVDAIFVSPLKRALDTVMQVIKIHKIIFKKAIILPNLSEVLSKICDLSSSIDDKIKQYHLFDFTAFSKVPTTKWQDVFVDSQIKLDIDQTKSDAERYIKAMHKQFPTPLQSEESCFSRSLGVMDQIKQICKKEKFQNILIVAHNRILKNINGRFNGGRVRSFKNSEIRIDWI